MIGQIYSTGIPHPAQALPGGTPPQFVLISSEPYLVPPEFSARYDLIFWLDMRSIRMDIRVTLRHDGAYVTLGASQGAGPAIIPPRHILAVDLPR